VSHVLTFLLSRAVPDESVESARIACWIWKNCFIYSIIVSPRHEVFWERFFKKYPHCERLAFEHGTLGGDSLFRCPAFSTKEDLINWLSNTLDLSLGERRLLHLCVRCYGY